ncbi:MFS transporter [Nocardia terpenica]|uniref:MFS transporter n=1 Tax=Nocardia terpenica TaxID=455432 RepID=UPI0012FE2611|nr:MFS transporter [Nocardia terpenica]
MHGRRFPLPSRTAAGMPLAAGGLLIAMPRVGLVVALVGRGYAMDRFGARAAVIASPTVAFVATALCILSTNHGVQGVLLLVAGMGTASINGVIAGWFPPDRRGVAMGIVQASERWSFPQSLRRTDFPARSRCPRYRWPR